MDSDVERITHSPIDEKAVLVEVADPGAGATLTFAGVVRNNHLGQVVQGIDYHGYQPMAAKEILKIEAEARERWPGVKAVIVHRIGLLGIGEVSVLIAVSSAHREEGFQALRYSIDTLKQRVPIWKKEIYTDGEAWIEGS